MHYLQGRYPVLEKKILAKNMVQYVILCPEIAAAAQPGQFVHILPVDHTLRRPISLCGIDKEKGTICIVFELKGSGTETLAACNVGDCMDVLGPLGHGFTLLPDAKRVVLLGGGIGNPPMLPLAQYYQERATVISGFRSAEFVILQEAFRLLVQKRFSAPITERSDGMDWSQNRCKNCCKPSRLMRCMPAARSRCSVQLRTLPTLQMCSVKFRSKNAWAAALVRVWSVPASWNGRENPFPLTFVKMALYFLQRRLFGNDRFICSSSGCSV